MGVDFFDGAVWGWKWVFGTERVIGCKDLCGNMMNFGKCLKEMNEGILVH